VLQCVAVCCSVLQCVAVCCSGLQWVAVGCSVLPIVSTLKTPCACDSSSKAEYSLCNMCVSCSVLQCVAVCCSVLQCVAHFFAVHTETKQT